MAAKNKTCIKCNKELSLKMFYKSTITKDGIDYYCKECRKSSSLSSHRGGTKKNKCSVKECQRYTYAKTLCRIHYARWDRNGSVELKYTIKDSYAEYPSMKYESVRRRRLMYTYKITLEKYEQMSIGGCEICGENPYEHKILHVDHDHKCCPVKYVNGNARKLKTCGVCIRGVLCNRCNAAVGRYEKGVMRKDYPLKDKIVKYVQKYNQLISDRIDTNDKITRNRTR